MRAGGRGIGILVSLAAISCAEQVVLLPPLDAGVADTIASGDLSSTDLGPLVRPFCPTTIDIFGGANVQLIGCGGGFEMMNEDDGYYRPGAASYEATLAGRVRARLQTDPELIARFGSRFVVRSCANPSGTLSRFAPAVQLNECSPPDSPPSQGQLSRLCLDHAAPVQLLIADDLADRCHGGGGDSQRPDDQAVFADHSAERIEAFRSVRRPKLLILAPKTEWHGPPNGPPDAASCKWRRCDWTTSGVEAWQRKFGAGRSRDVIVVGDRHAEWRGHNRCCAALGVPCGADWFQSFPWLTNVNCAGAKALSDYWFGALKNILLTERFQCP